MADGGFIKALGTGNVGVAALFKEHLPDELLLARLQLGDGVVQPLVILGLEDVPQHIHIGWEKGIVQVVSIQGAVAAGLLVVDVVLLPVQIDQDGPPIIGDLDFHGFSCELILDLHFRVLSAWGGQGGDTKIAGTYQPRTKHSQKGRTGSRVLIMPLPTGRVGVIASSPMCAHRLRYFIISTARAALTLLLYITICAEKQKGPEQRRYDDTCIAPALVVAISPGGQSATIMPFGFAPLRFRFLSHQCVQVGKICVPAFPALNRNRDFGSSITKRLALATPGAEEMIAHFCYFVCHGIPPFRLYA